MAPDLIDRILKLKQLLSNDNEEQPSSDAIKQFNETSIFSQNKRCMGETLLLIRRMSEKYGGSQDNADSEKNKNSDVLNKCSGIMKQLHMIHPWEEGDEITQHVQQTYQMQLSSVLDELEKMVENPPENPNPQPSHPNLSPDELASLKKILLKKNAIRQLLEVSNKLLLLREALEDEKDMSAQKEEQEVLAHDPTNCPDDTKRELESDNEDKGSPRSPRSVSSNVKRIYKNLL
ncbi:uncharacterized protein [Drosophila bipectinata]|uniref:uncharacterized protein n=1 Tax=Drosophila bipectinata TaxID=42026 RepID=UPI001C8A4B34|nr:uncharacterized protein LOC122321062 [Drosophila bipectinata]